MARKTVSDDFKIFSKRLSVLMKERHITQDTLATTIGVKRQTVSLYKSGQSMPDAEVLRDIAVFFGVSSDWLLGLTDVRMPNTDVQAICARTGLSETAVSGLMNMKQFAEPQISGTSPVKSSDRVGMHTPVFRDSPAICHSNI